MIIAITTQTAKSYTKQDTLRAAVRSLDFSVLHYDDENILAAVAIAPEIPHANLTDGETGLYLVNAPIEKMGIDVLLQSVSFTLIQSNTPFPILMQNIKHLTPLRMQGIRFR